MLKEKLEILSGFMWNVLQETGLSPLPTFSLSKTEDFLKEEKTQQRKLYRQQFPQKEMSSFTFLRVLHHL